MPKYAASRRTVWVQVTLIPALNHKVSDQKRAAYLGCPGCTATQVAVQKTRDQNQRRLHAHRLLGCVANQLGHRRPETRHPRPAAQLLRLYCHPGGHT